MFVSLLLATTLLAPVTTPRKTVVEPQISIAVDSARGEVVITAGPYVCTTYFPTDNKTGVDPAVLTEEWNWRGSEIRSEAQDRRHGAPHGEGDRGSGSGTAISAAMLVSRYEIRRPEPERLRRRLYPCARAFTTAAPKPGAPDFMGSVT